MNLVVGSGPSGVAATMALLDRGLPVTMLDAGREIEPKFAETPGRLARLRYDAWPPELRDQLAEITGPMVRGFPMKTNFGSEFAYRGAPEVLPFDVRDSDIISSLARGGLSNLWGSNVVSFCDRDFRGWPIDAGALAPSYRAVLRHIPLSASRGDDFETLLPLHTDTLEPRLLSNQAARVLRDLDAHRERLHASGIRYGPSRLGLRTSAGSNDAGCERCGLCLHGCPYDLIYNSSQTLATLQRDPNLRYEPGLLVTRFRETADGVEVEAVRESDRGPVRFSGSRLFLAAGCYSTARIVLGSLERFSSELRLLESQYFLMPLLHARGTPGAAQERLQTLSQLCLRLRDAAVSPEDVHMLIYTYTHLYRKLLDATPLKLVPGLKGALLERLLALQGYLHSDVSPHLTLSLRDGGSEPHTLEVCGHVNPATAPTIRRIEARMRSLAGVLQALPIPFATKIAPPGKSYHVGGTFPMQRAPGPLQSDLLGRPMGLARVHVVDASAFTTIPATNLTLTVMANAHRIASESAAIDVAQAGVRRLA